MAAGVFLTLILMLVVIGLVVKISNLQSEIADLQTGKVIHSEVYNKISNELREIIESDIYSEILQDLKEKTKDEVQIEIEEKINILKENLEEKERRKGIYRILKIMGDVRASYFKD